MLRQRQGLPGTGHIPHDVHGGFASLPAPRRRILRPETPWRNPTFFDSEWLSFDDSLKDEIAAELGLWDDLELDADMVQELEAHDLEATQAVHDRLTDSLIWDLEQELDRRVKARILSRRQADKELSHFRNVTAELVVDRMTAHVLQLLQQEAGLE